MSTPSNNALSSANPGLVKASRLLVLSTLDEVKRPMSAGELAKSTEVGEHYVSLALLSLEEEAKVIKFKGQSEGRGAAPFLYRRPTESEVKAVQARRAIAAKVAALLPGASVSIHGVTADLETIAVALGVIPAPKTTDAK